MRLDASYAFCCMSYYIERETMDIFITSIQSIVPIIVIIILGYFLQVRGWFQESFGNDLSKLIMNVAIWWFALYVYRLHSWLPSGLYCGESF